MKETARLQKMFADLYAGDPWLDVTITGTLSNLNAQQATYRPGENWNSIWEITNHLILWRENVLERIKGQTMVSPEDNYFRPVADTSDRAWESTLQQLQNTQQAWIAFLDQMREEKMEKVYSINHMTYADHIHGIIQHDAYHLGQIVMLAKHASKINQS
ncbi:DinB family protein [Flavobacterium sp.]|uniref:DinB family protein n=1 Tax=Flavobacterium sp. TaxID=239 RepID=UPI0039E61D6E